MAQRFEMMQKQAQRMMLSPQMQQAMHLLQMPLMDLQALLQQELILNPVLEEQLSAEEPAASESTEAKSEEHEAELDFKEEFNSLTKLDDEWKDYFSQSGSFKKITQQDEEKRRFAMESITTSESLQEHLLSQLRLAVADEGKKALGELIIGNIDDNGYLRYSIDDLSQQSGKPAEEIEEILSIIQSFNPVGAGARDLKECLLIQLDRLGKSNTLASLIVEKHLDLVGEHDYKQIGEFLNAPEAEVEKAANIILTLDPKPGMMFSRENVQYVVPDAYVEKIEGEYVVTLNDERIPHLYISKLYRSLMASKDTSQETRDYIRNKIQAGNWLIKNILQRQQTIYKIATEITRAQNVFLDEGPSFIKPLTMQDVASAVMLHESTISRAISGKYIQTPRGTFQFRYFFSAGIKTESGESLSIKNIKEQIDDMIKNEEPGKPLSDQDIVEKLAEKGIKLARRTIAKYRHELGIAVSTARKKI